MCETTIRLNRPMRRGVRTLGFGTRLAVWVQGCSIACPGCTSRDTWDRRGGVSVLVADLAAQIVAAAPTHDGLTITGGEPMQQPDAVAELVALVRRGLGTRDDFDVLCYTGMLVPRLAAAQRRALDQVDAVIDGPFVLEEPTELAFRGSANQQLHRWSELGERRYRELPSASAGLQVVLTVDGQAEWIGIPRRGEMQAIADAAKAQGIELEGPSW